MNNAVPVKGLRFLVPGMAALGIVLFGLSFLWEKSRVDPVAVSERAKAIADREGIVIGLGSPDTFFVAPYTAADARDVLVNGNTASPVEIDRVPPALDGIEAALRAYPPGFFRGSCKAIFLCGSLTLDGSRAGGTWNKAWIILPASKEYGEKGIYEVALFGLHHEFSSLIWTRFPELQARWKALLPPGWAPAQRNAEALKASDRLTVEAMDGFLSPYGSTTAENDFNVYAETLFTDASKIALQAERSPVVAKKLALLMEVYILLDKRFEAIFERLHLLRFMSALPTPVGEGISISPSFVPPGRIVPSLVH